MANSAGVCYIFKRDLLTAKHNFTPTTGHTFHFALFEAAGSLTPSTVTAHGAAPANANEVSATGGNAGIYTSGGSPVTNTSAGNISDGTGTTAFWTPNAAVSWTGITFTSVDCALLHNNSNSKAAVALFTFGAVGLPSGGNFTLTMPANGASTGLIRIA